MHLILIGIVAGIGCCAMNAHTTGVLCITLGSCLQCVVDELEKIKNKLK